MNLQKWRWLASGGYEADWAAVNGSDPPIFDEQGQRRPDGVEVGEASSVGSHGVSDGELGVAGAVGPVEDVAGLYGGLIDAPVVGDGGHVVEVVVADLDCSSHGWGVDVGVGVAVGEVEEAGDADDVGSEFADPFGEVFEFVAGPDPIFERLVPFGEHLVGVGVEGEVGGVLVVGVGDVGDVGFVAGFGVFVAGGLAEAVAGADVAGGFGEEEAGGKATSGECFAGADFVEGVGLDGGDDDEVGGWDVDGVSFDAVDDVSAS